MLYSQIRTHINTIVMFVAKKVIFKNKTNNTGNKCSPCLRPQKLEKMEDCFPLCETYGLFPSLAHIENIPNTLSVDITDY